MDKYMVERLLKNFFYADILNKIVHPCKQSHACVYGKEILFFKNDEAITMGELESWSITADIDCESATLESLQDLCLNLAQNATEYEIAQLGNKNADNCTCHALCEWRFLENEVGGIINRGKVHLVKYAKILEDIRQ